MKRMINVFDRATRRKIAVLQNAYNITETMPLNKVYSLVFSLPENDEKNEFCQPFHYVQYGDDGDLYRIIAPGATISNTGVCTYTCEHVIATLIDDVLFGAFTVGNLGVYTADSIRWVLAHQSTQNWVLDVCDFTNQFEYGWEHENLLAALFSIANRFTSPYKWCYDTRSYPWRLSLERIDSSQKPQFYVRAGKNLLKSSKSGSCQEVCTRLYGLGYGEGINQLTIESVNNGIPYLQAGSEYTNRYGIVSRIFIDRRFEDAKSLKEKMQSVLEELKEPAYSRSISVADLYPLTEDDCDKAEIGRIAMLTDDNTKTYITKTVRKHDVPGNLSIEFSTRATDIINSLADMADRQRIEQVYAQGATQLYAQSIQANATPQKGAVLNFFIPSEMRVVNAVKAKITLDRFRSYSEATESTTDKQTTTPTTDDTQTTTPTTDDAQTTTPTTDEESVSSDITTDLTTADNTAVISLFQLTAANIDPGNSWGGIYNSHQYHEHVFAPALPNHQHKMNHEHSFTIPGHQHEFTIPGHQHEFTIPGHQHEFTIPGHKHAIKQGIFEFGRASGADIYVNGVKKGTMGASSELDITQYLVGNDNTIPRGSWMRVEIRPNDLAYVTVDMFVQGFVQSRGGNTY